MRASAKVLEKMVLMVTQAHNCGTMPASRKPCWSMALTNIPSLTVKARFQAQRWSLELKTSRRPLTTYRTTSIRLDKGSQLVTTSSSTTVQRGYHLALLSLLRIIWYACTCLSPSMYVEIASLIRRPATVRCNRNASVAERRTRRERPP